VAAIPVSTPSASPAPQAKAVAPRKSGGKSSAEPPAARPAAPAFAADEIDGLMDEVAEAPDVALTGDVSAVGSGSPRVRGERRSEPRVAVEIETVTDDRAVFDGVDLFNDPSLEVAQLGPGQTREILVPVEVACGAGTARRYRLSLRLRVDPER
jgi:hypothetical protein